ncbi:hypothetical protein GI582_22905 [Sulfitobacter sp. BDSS02]|nr:hypothetical protein [Sulfitobacter sp. BDSS02]
MADKFSSHVSSINSPPENIFGVTPDDGADLPNASRALNVAQSGTVRVTTVGGDTETLFLAAGIAFPVRVQRIWSSGTTATGIVAMF